MTLPIGAKHAELTRAPWHVQVKVEEEPEPEDEKPVQPDLRPVDEPVDEDDTESTDPEEA